MDGRKQKQLKLKRNREKRKWSWLRFHRRLSPVKKRRHLSGKERRKCRRVAAVFRDMYRHEDLVVLDAGAYGFVKLQDYRPPVGFGDVETFTDSRDMFEDLWTEWIYSQLISLIKDSPLEQLDYVDIYESLPPHIRKKADKIKRRLMKRAGLVLQPRLFQTFPHLPAQDEGE